MNDDVEAYLAGKPAPAVELFRIFRQMVLDAGDCEERVHPTEVVWAVKRAFAAAFILSGRLEIAIDLLRTVNHPTLRQSFPTTSRVMTHRFKITSKEQLDEDILAWLVEARETVGPGTR